MPVEYIDDGTMQTTVVCERYWEELENSHAKHSDPLMRHVFEHNIKIKNI